MRYLFGFICVCALGVVPLVGCGNDATGDGGTAGMGGAGGTGGNVTEAIEEMLVGRWWVDWDKAPSLAGGIGLPTFTADGWANYDVKFPVGVPGVTEWCRRYANWSLFDVVSETEFGYALTYTHDTCSRETGWTEQFKVVLDQTNPPNGEVTRLSSTNPGVMGDFTIPIERCTTDINATEACTFDTGLGAPTQNPVVLTVTATEAPSIEAPFGGPPFEGVELCQTDTTNCATTDADGHASIMLPFLQEISYTVEKEGYAPFLVADVTDFAFAASSFWPMFSDAQVAGNFELLGLPYPRRAEPLVSKRTPRWRARRTTC